MTIFRPSRFPSFSLMVITSAIPWQGWYLSHSMLITGTSAAAAKAWT